MTISALYEPYPAIAYDPRRHSAARTGNYIYAQLIPYLGNKRKLLSLISAATEVTGVRTGVFADLFAGSGVVSRWAKSQGRRVVTNDWEPYSQPINTCHVGLNRPPIGAAELLNILNALPPAATGHFTENYCPIDDLNPKPLLERCFFTRANGLRIDAIRDKIAQWESEGRLDEDTKAYLLAPLLYAASYVSNTSGVFKAYHNGWGGQTKTALYRICSDIHLSPPVLIDNGQRNVATRLDAQLLAERWGDIAACPMDIAYLDPPYNQHPYGSNYHLLNTVALYDKPDVPEFGRGSKSAIRTDWRTIRRSAYNHSKCALDALTSLVDALPARWVLLSYSTDGNIPTESLFTALAQRGATTLLPKRYKRYRVSTPRMSLKAHNVEFVLVLDKQARPGLNRVGDHQSALLEAALG